MVLAPTRITLPVSDAVASAREDREGEKQVRGFGVEEVGVGADRAPATASAAAPAGVDVDNAAVEPVAPVQRAERAQWEYADVFPRRVGAGVADAGAALGTRSERGGRRGMHEVLPAGSAEWPARSLLGRLSPTARRDVLGLGAEVRFDTGAVLLREGMHDRHVLLLLSGCVKVTATVENGETSLLAIRAGGDTVGEMAALDGAPRSATVTACGPLTARSLKDGALRELLGRRSEVSIALSAIVADRLRWANRRRLDFRGYPAKVRLARLLVELAASYGFFRTDGVVIDIQLTQPELAALAGAAETTVHKVLRELREEGLLETGYRATVIRDLTQLRRLADLADEEP